MRGKKDSNALDLIPSKKEGISWNLDTDNNVVIKNVHKGIYAKIAHIAFGRPKVSYITLEKFGSFIWHLIDGNHSIGEIAELVKEEFGEEIEPLYNRLIAYLRILNNQKFICLQK